MNNRRHTGTSVPLDILPNIQDGTAGCIDYGTACFGKQIDLRRGYSESGKDNDVLRRNVLVLLGARCK